ncbi:MAG: B12-binding domain-containing radical SAM protein [Phycisphaerales bacterium]
MKIAFVAMSGVRVENPELKRVGLTLPGFVERSQVIASLPSLSLLTMAGLTPDDIEVEYHEVADLGPDSCAGLDADLVAISTFTAQIEDAYALADRLRDAGIPVVLGGLHVTSLPDEAQAHADAIVIGEGELSWPRLVDDFRSNRLAPRYEARPGEEFDLAAAPMPRFDLLDIERFNRIPVQTSRGCPHQCDFCASSILLTRGYKTKPVEKVIAEIHRIKEFWPEPFIELADDNSFCQRGHARRLLRALTSERLRWFTETDVSIADHPDLLDLLRESGCRQLLIGLESPTAAALGGVEIRRDWKLRQFDRYERAVRVIQSHGITVNGCFVLGLDGHDASVFDSVYDFVERTGLYDVQITVMTPLPGTPLYERLERSGRLLYPGVWRRCTLFDVNYVPSRMSPERLEEGLIDLTRRLNDPDFVRERRERFFRQWRRNDRRASVFDGSPLEPEGV